MSASRVETAVRRESLAPAGSSGCGTFPASAHVFDTGLARFTSDEVIWDYAKANDFTIVTADADFLDLAKDRGAPPKVVWLENCNYKMSRVEDLLRRHAVRIAEFDQSARPVLIIRNKL